MAEKYNPFTGKGDFQTPKDTPYKGLKRYLTESDLRKKTSARLVRRKTA